MSPTPEQLQRLTVSRRVLRAKQGELEAFVRNSVDTGEQSVWLTADVALVCSVLADVIERLEDIDATSP